ncbi:hypothetical protein D3C77_593960 [compost metagenome]
MSLAASVGKAVISRVEDSRRGIREILFIQWNLPYDESGHCISITFIPNNIASATVFAVLPPLPSPYRCYAVYDRKL